VQDSQTKLKRQSGDLACLSRTVVLLATLKCGLSDAERVLLESYLCPEGGEGGASGITEQGMEETMDASLTYLLKTALAKNTKESATLSNTTLEVRLRCAVVCCVVDD
jgi:PTHB1 C-terminus